VTTWRHFAKKQLPCVIRELGIPCAEPARVTGMNRCPRHQRLLGPTTRMCIACHNEAWDEIGRRYRDQERPAETERRTTMNENTSTELVRLEPDETMPAPPPITLFGTTDPRLAMERMSDLATVLVDVVKDRKLAVRINGRDFLTAEAWTTLGGMVGVVPVVEWTRPNESGDGYLARVEARTLDGRVVGAAECECSRGEQKWKNRDAFALRSMASTRAISRALRAPLGMIVVLAGYEPASSDEMPVVDVEAHEPGPEPGPIPAERRPSDEQWRELTELVGRLRQLDPETDWPTRCRELAGAPSNLLTGTMAADLIDRLQAELAPREENTR
jgi:hypothetical protein